MKHTKTDPVCIHYKETGPFRRYLNARGLGRACLICVPLFKVRPLHGHHEQVMCMARDLAATYWPTK